MTTLRDVLRRALDELGGAMQAQYGERPHPDYDETDLAIEVLTQLRAAGLAIHDDAKCVRPSDDVGGRAMTPEELATLPLGEHVPKARRRQS